MKSSCSSRSARKLENISKADLARAIGANPAVIRRLFSSSNPNPTIGTVAEVAAVLGFRLSLVRMPAEEREALAQPLLEGRAAESTAELATKMRAA